ncbi:MAG: zinc ABC transporter substrate-binding protein [Spirochaetales bacterium]|nr:zinc ABC transporter substrate-binding protein [Spirochaetales bacterium]
MKFRIPFILNMLVLILPFLSAGGQGEESLKKTYFVSILPQAYLLERIGGDRIDVQVMVPPGKSPATYEPTPRQVMALGGAEAFFILGVPFERNFLPSLKGSLAGLYIADASEGIERRHLDSHHHDGEEEDHDEGTEDPHIWLSPVLAEQIARNMTRVLMEKDPEGSTGYEKNLSSLLADLESLDGELEETLAPFAGETLFVYHPSFGYFADRYGLQQEAIELGGKEPTPADLEKIISEARNDGVRIILVQPEFSLSSANAVAKAIGGAVIPVETLNGDYLNNLRDLANHLRDGLK